jgi:hypothetical protein
MKTPLAEGLPPMIPQYPVKIAGHSLTLRFDVNINKTKKGVKLQFVMKDIPQDPRQAQQMANEIGTELQEKFGAADLQVIYDVENPYKNVIGFLLPLPSLADYIIKHVLKDEPAGEEVEQDAEEGEREAEVNAELPDRELGPNEPVREILQRRAGLK